MLIHREPLESVVERSTIVIVVDVDLVSEAKTEGCWRIIDFTALPVEIVFGQMTMKSAFSCRYSQGMPHERGGIRVSPLVTGSGLELDIKKGDRAVFLLESEATALEILTLLRAEPLANLEIIRRTPGRARGVERI